MTPSESGILATDDPAIRLRPVNLPDDIPAATAWYQDPEVLHFSQGDGSVRFDPVMIETMFTAMATRCEVYIIDLREPGGWRPIGDASLCREAGTPITIGHARDRDRGIGRIVLARLVQRAKELGWPEMVVSGIFTDNLRARHLYEGAGFRVTGEIPAGDNRSQWTMRLPLASGNAPQADSKG